MQKTILAFGEILWDLLPTGAMLGGAPFNFAFRVNSLGDRGIIASRLGRDELGRKAHEQAAVLGMDTSLVQWDNDHPTGTVKVSIDEKRNPDFFIVPDVAYDFIEAEDALLELANEAHCLYFGTLIQRTPIPRQTLKQLLGARERCLKFLDLNLRRDCYSAETITDSVEVADMLKLNESEAGHLAALFNFSARSLPELCEQMIRRWALTYCLVTLGERGVFAAACDYRKIYVPGYRVKVADTCGAGDAFSAGFINELFSYGSLTECCRLGNALGAMVATQTGATSMIEREEIERFLREPRDRIIEPSLEGYLVD